MAGEKRPRGAHFAPVGGRGAAAAPEPAQRQREPLASPDTPAASRPVRPDETAVFLAAAARSESCSATTAHAVQAEEPLAAASVSEDDDFDSSGDYEVANRKAGLMTGLIVVSRVTGFIRTWAMGAALGLSLLSSSYQIAYNLPGMLYELVMGGMLVTAFLPVYMEARRMGGREGGSAYVSNLLSILLVILGVVALLATVCAPAIIWTQSFMSADRSQMDTAVYFFRFFAVEIVFYGLGSVFSGVLNAHRDYFWSNFAPVLNNLVVIASFGSFVLLDHAGVDSRITVTMLAVGTTLGVFLQMACQIPALAKHGVHMRLRINLRDPLLRKTVSLGLPTLIVTVCTFIISSVQTSSVLAVQPETGASVAAYSRLWYTLPYALLAVPVNTALYTELARDAAQGDEDAVRSGMSNGIAQQFFCLIPFAFYLMVFSFPLNMIYCTGKFDVGGVELVSEYLRFLAVGLPFYGVGMLMQKGCSALMNMRPYAVFMVVGTIAEISWTLVFGVRLGGGMPVIALANAVFYLVANAGSILWMRKRLNGLKMRVILHGVFFGVLLGGIGAAVGGGVLKLLEFVAIPLVSTAGGTVVTAPVPVTFAYVVVAGIASLVATFVPAVLLKLPEARAITAIVARFKR